jgi:tRNA dimethylallyltransferase
MSLVDGENIPRVVVVVGPTASGKSDLAAWVAKAFDGEIVNADSMQVYRGMNIGTAKPSKDTMSATPHHLFDIVDPDEEFTAAEYVRRARLTVLDIHSRNKIPVIVGGTGLYIRALLSGLAESPGCDAALREEYLQYALANGNEALHKILCSVDPLAGARLHANNRVRVIRALEVFRLTGRSIVEFQQEHSFALKWCNYLKIGIHVERAELYRRINLRVERMISEGLIAEVQALMAAGYLPDTKPLSAIGYREMCAYLAGEISLAEAISLIKRNTRHYAKRQFTWFNSEDDISWFSYPQDIDKVDKAVKGFLTHLQA